MKTAHRQASRAKRHINFGTTQFFESIPRHQVAQPKVKPIELAIASARAFTPAQRELLLKGPHAAVEALQFGQFDEHHWRELADVFNVAEQMAKPPVNLANDHADKFEEAHCVLYALSEQYRDRKSWTARAPQLQAIKDALEIYEIQIENVGQGEFERTLQRVTRRMQEALRGNGNCVLIEALS